MLKALIKSLENKPLNPWTPFSNQIGEEPHELNSELEENNEIKYKPGSRYQSNPWHRSVLGPQKTSETLAHHSPFGNRGRDKHCCLEWDKKIEFHAVPDPES